MSRSFLRRAAAATLLVVGLTACADQTPDDTTDEAAEQPAEDTADDASDVGDDAEDDPAGTDAEVAGEAATFPVTVTDDVGEVVIEERPEAVVSLSPTHTEMLFAVGAGEQVVAADEFSDFPPEAPTTDLSGFTPNVEAVLGYDPDLVVIQFDPGDLVAGLTEAGVPVLTLGVANDLQTAFSQFEALGAATGNDAEPVIADIQQQLDELSASVDVEVGLTYYHEISADLFSATSATFIGEIYGLYGLENIADGADPEAGGFPQLSREYLVDQDPDYVFLACTELCGVTADSFCAREGLGGLSACADGDVVELDDDVASRWGPRMVDFAEEVADALAGG